jgi:DNA-binding response OmpR family regulator
MTGTPGTGGPGATILVVDDEVKVRSLLTLTLRTNGYDVLDAADGLEAFDIFRVNSQRIGLLIADVAMPNMRGPALAQRIRELQPKMPVLFITGLDLPPDLTFGDMVMYKPFTASGLLAKVRKMLP